MEEASKCKRKRPKTKSAAEPHAQSPASSQRPRHIVHYRIGWSLTVLDELGIRHAMSHSRAFMERYGKSLKTLNKTTE